jgi:dihydropteroate synthase
MNPILEDRIKRIPKIGTKTLVMGILNVTPDSFSDGGRHYGIEQAVNHAKKLVRDGADILDIGGESTRPGAEPVSLEDELARVLPVIRAVRQELNIPISIDTYKAEVARCALLEGADIINDIWRGIGDPAMPRIAAEFDVPIILMHNRNNKQYKHLMRDIIADLYESIDLLKAAGVDSDKIWLDPGIGFAKTPEDNLEVMAHLDSIAAMGYPVVLGTSRKSFIGLALNLPMEERLEGTLATVCYGIQKGCQIVRVHDVLEASRVCRMMDAMVYREGN